MIETVVDCSCDKYSSSDSGCDSISNSSGSIVVVVVVVFKVVVLVVVVVMVDSKSSGGNYSRKSSKSCGCGISLVCRSNEMVVVG